MLPTLSKKNKEPPFFSPPHPTPPPPPRTGTLVEHVWFTLPPLDGSSWNVLRDSTFFVVEDFLVHFPTTRWLLFSTLDVRFEMSYSFLK